MSQLFTTITKYLKQAIYKQKKFILAHGSGGSQFTIGQASLAWDLVMGLLLCSPEEAIQHHVTRGCTHVCFSRLKPQ